VLAVRFDVREVVNDASPTWDLDALRKAPTGLRVDGSFEDGKSGFESNGGRSVRRGKQGSKGLERRARKIAEFVRDGTGEFLHCLFDGGVEVIRGLQPVVNGGAVNAGISGGLGHGPSLCERGGDLDLSGCQLLNRKRCRKCRIL
jgi:hypothetical protein